MKFGKRMRCLASPEWEGGYVDYKGLKRLVKTMTGSDAERSNEFHQALLRELSKVNASFFWILDDLTRQHEDDSLLTTLHHHPSPTSSSSTLEQHEWAAALQDQLERVLHLSSRVDALRRFVVINYLAVVKIAKKFDKTTASHTSQPVDVAGDLLLQPFYAGSYVDHLYSQTAAVLDSLVQALVAPVPLPSLDASCPICLYPFTSPVTLGCQHTFCWSCLAKAAAHHIHACPLCRQVQSIDPRDYEIDGLVKRFGNLYTQLQFELSFHPGESSSIITTTRSSSPSVSSASPRSRATSTSSVVGVPTAHAVLAHAKQVADDLLDAVQRQYAMAPPSTAVSSRRDSASSSSSMVLDQCDASHPMGERAKGNSRLLWPRVISIAATASSAESFDNAIDHSGCHMIALRVYLSGSGDIVVHTDAVVGTADDEGDVFLSEVSTDDLETRHNIWTLHRVLSQLSDRHHHNPVAVLVSVSQDEAIPPLMALLAAVCHHDDDAFWTSSMFYIASGNHYQLLAIHGHRVALPTLTELRTVVHMSATVPLGYCRNLEQLHVSHVCADVAAVTAAFAADAHRRGLGVFVSNVQSARVAWKVLEDMGGVVDGMISHRPAMLGATLVQHALAQDRRGAAGAVDGAKSPTSTATTVSPRGSLEKGAHDAHLSSSLVALHHHHHQFDQSDEYTGFDEHTDDDEGRGQTHVFSAGDPVEMLVEGTWFPGVVLEVHSKAVVDEDAADAGHTTISLSYSVLWWRSDNSQRRATKVAATMLRVPIPQYRPSYLGLGIDAAYGALKAAIEWATFPFTTTSTG